MKYSQQFWELYDHCMQSELNQEYDSINSGLGIFELPNYESQIEQPHYTRPAHSNLSELIISSTYQPVGPDDDDLLDIIPQWDSNSHDRIFQQVLQKLSSYGLSPDQNQQDSLKKMVRVVLGNKNLKRPIILPVAPGMGKTTLLLELIIDQLKYDDKWCAIIVVERAEDIHRHIAAIEKAFSGASVEAWPTFTTLLKCPAGFGYFDYDNCHNCNAQKFNCPVKNDLKGNGIEPPSFKASMLCPIGKKRTDYHSHVCRNCSDIINPRACDPGIREDIRLNTQVIFITHKYYYDMLEFHESLEGLMNYRYYGSYLRRQIFVDERPLLTDTGTVGYSLFLSALTIIREHLPIFLDDVKDISKSALDMYYQSSNRIVDGIPKFKWPPGLKSEWDKLWKDGKHQEKGLLIILENLLNDGGYYMSNHMGTTEVFSLAHYVKANTTDNRTVIFDGTGLADKLYDQHRFNVLESIDKRDYSSLHIHIYPKNLSLTFYEKHVDGKFYDDFCNTIDQIATNTKTLVVGYKDYLNEFRSRLNGANYYFDYWGSMLGKNDYSKAEIVFFTGVIDFGNHVYSAYAKVLTGNNPIADLAKEKDEIKINQKLVMLYQLIYRSKLREYTQDDIHVYVPANSKLAAELPTMFRGCNVFNDWAPNPHPHTFILQKIRKDKSVKHATEAIRFFVRQEKGLPDRDAIKLVWSSMGKQGWTRLRNGVGKEELAKLGDGRKKV